MVNAPSDPRRDTRRDTRREARAPTQGDMQDTRPDTRAHTQGGTHTTRSRIDLGDIKDAQSVDFRRQFVFCAPLNAENFLGQKDSKIGGPKGLADIGAEVS